MGVSRRALLGYSSSAAAGAVLASSGSAQAEESTVVAEQAADTPTAWDQSVPFRGAVMHPEEGSLVVTFNIDLMPSPVAQNVTALDIANAINELATSRGWPPMTFYGAVHTALN